MLNKFAVVPEHFILATSAFEPQTHLLSAADLAATLACLEAYDGGQLFAFFNSGPHSGASQPHRHVQLLPVEHMRDGLDGAGSWDVLANALLDDGVREKLPFAVAASRIVAAASPDELRATYLQLYREACAAAGVDLAEELEGEAAISYNLAMTHETMVLCTRVAEGTGVRTAGGESAGTLALNGTVLAGTALVRYQEEWDALRGDPEQLAEVLRKIGIPRD